MKIEPVGFSRGHAQTTGVYSVILVCYSTVKVRHFNANFDVSGTSDEGNAFAIFDHLSDPVVVTDARFQAPGPRIIYVNDAFTARFGLSSAELVDQPLTTVHPDLASEDKLDAVGQCCRRKQTYQNRATFHHKDGSTLSVSWRIAPVFRGSSLECLLCLVSGISGSLEFADTLSARLKATEAALRESENQLKAIFDHSPAEIYLKDAEGRYVRTNRHFEMVFDVRDEDVRGKLPHEVHYEELADSTRAHDLEVLRTGQDVVREESVHLKGLSDDFPHLLHTLKFPIRDNGDVVGLGAIVTDITDTKKAENALRESEGRLRDFAEIAADWFWETDENLVVTYVSDVHRQITGIPDAKIIGRTREQLFSEGIYTAMSPEIHLRTLRNHWDSMVEYSVTREDGREVIVHDRASPFFDHQGNFRGYRGVGRDITEQRRLTERIAYQATRDSLTGTVNRREFERHLEEAISDARARDAWHVLCYVDLDRFKLLNDTLGHAAGDHLLKVIVEQINAAISPDDLLGRIGGDEFGILLRNTGIERAEQLALRISRGIKVHDFKWEDRRFSVAMSVGLAPINNQTKSSSELLARADSACYRAKEAGEDGVWVSDEREAARLRTYTDILRSLASGPVDLSDNFQLVGQPICALADPACGPAWYEVLLRLVGDDGHFYRPFEFIRLAEQHGKMPVIDQWVLETAIASHAHLAHRVPDAVMSINLSGTSLNNGQRADVVDRLVAEHDLKPGNLCFEIGERAAMADLKGTTELVESLLKQGYRVALDEFGSGPSSFSCLKHLPVQYIKIYGELVRELRQDEPTIAIIESINKLASQLSMTAIAVQVESRPAADILKDIGVEFGQGNALATTRPLGELVRELSGRSQDRN